MVNTGTNSGKAAFATALTAVVIGGSVLAGWMFEQEYPSRIILGHTTMNPATAVAFILTGVSLALFLWFSQGSDQKSRGLILTARLCASAAILIGLARLIATLSGWDLGVDRWLFASKMVNGLEPRNHVAPNTALNLLLLGGAILLMDVKSRSVRRGVEFAAVAVGLVSLLAVLGYAYGIQPLYRIGPFGAMAMHTAITFSILSVGVLLSHTDSGFLAVFAGNSTGGKLARRLLPAAVLITALIGWLTRLGEEADYSVAFCGAVETVGNISTLTFLICWSAQRLYNADVRRSETEAKTRESEERFSGAFEHAPIGVALISPGGRWLKVNRALCDLLGYSEGELLTRTIQEITHPEDVEASRENVRRMDAGEMRSFQIRKRYVHSRGHFVTALVNVSRVRDDQGQPGYAIVQIQDITEHERAAAALLESKRFLQATLDSLSSHIAILDEHGMIIEVNAAWNRFGDQTCFEGGPRVAGDNYLESCDVAAASSVVDAAALAGGIRAVIAGRSDEFQLEYPCHSPQEQRWFLMRATRFGGAGPTRVVMARENVTARKKGEEEVRRNEQRYRSLVEATAAIVWTTDGSGQFKVEQPDWTAFTGQSFKELRGWGWLKTIHPDDQTQTLQAWSVAVANRSIYQVEHRVRTGSGTYRNMLVRAAPILAENGPILEWIGVHSDITERKQAEASRMQLAAIIESSEDAIVGKDLNSNVTSWNAAAERMFGYFALEIMGTSIRRLIPQDRQAEEERIMSAIKRGEPVLHFETVRLTKNGRMIDVSVTVSPIKDAVGNVVGASKITRDITEHKRAEERLRESEERYRALIEWSPEPIAVHRRGILLFVNSAAVRMMGANSARDLVGRSSLDLVHPDSRRNVIERRKTHAANGGDAIPMSAEQFIRLDGTVIDVETQGTRIVYDGEPAIYLSMRDVTDRKRAEAELRWKTAFLEAQVNSSLDGILVVDGQGKKLLQNQRFTDLLKIPRHIADDRDDEKQVLWVTGMTKDPAAFIVKVAHLKSHPAETSRDEIALTDGTFLDRYSAPVVGNDGTYYGRIWTFRDATERTRSEALLLESQQRLALATESAHIGIWDWNVVENEMVWDAQMLALYGLSPQDFSGAVDAWQNGLHREDKERAETEIAAALAGPHDFRSEFRVVWPSGNVHQIEAYGVVQRAADGSARRMIGVNWDVTARKQTEARFRRLVDSDVQSILFWNAKGRITGANDSFLTLTGYSREDLEGGRVDWMAMTPPEHAQRDRHALEQIAATGACVPYEKEFIRKDGGRVPILIGAAAFEDNPEEGVCFVLDLTERKRLETQLVQSQKLETVGRLAGGIAHEFNSILTAIIGQSELLLSDLPVGSPLITNANEISKAAGRAAALTRQLLAYGRKQLLQSESLDLSRVVTRMEGVLRHLMGVEIDTRIVATPGLRAVKADAGQLEQVIMNMAINAREAMPNGGKLTLETANVSFDEESVSHYPELKPGDYVMLAITDTGTGMSMEVKARMFEPFFSTKEVGQGTGLGLSTCYGIIKQSGGHISAYSELGFGATFKIYLPQVAPTTMVPLRHPTRADLPRGTETILLVEDDPALRAMAANLLNRLGYTVFAAANGIEALSLKQQHGTGHIDLLFTDVAMPHMSGKELADRVRALYPLTRVLFTSANTENAIVHQDMLKKGVAILQKPFMPSALAHKLREVLDLPVGEVAPAYSPVG